MNEAVLAEASTPGTRTAGPKSSRDGREECLAKTQRRKETQALRESGSRHACRDQEGPTPHCRPLGTVCCERCGGAVTLQVILRNVREGARAVERDPLKELYSDLLEGDYDCVDRFVLNAYSPYGVRPGGFRHWWRLLHGGNLLFRHPAPDGGFAQRFR